MLMQKITKVKNQLKKNKSLHAGFCMTFQKCRLLIFFKVTLFRKITKQIRNTFSIKQFGSRSGPMCFGPCLRETSSLISIQNCVWLTLADEELTGFFIYAAFYLL